MMVVIMTSKQVPDAVVGCFGRMALRREQWKAPPGIEAADALHQSVLAAMGGGRHCMISLLHYYSFLTPILRRSGGIEPLDLAQELRRIGAGCGVHGTQVGLAPRCQRCHHACDGGRVLRLFLAEVINQA